MRIIEVLLGGLSHWTVGLVATFIAATCVGFADTGAYFVGKSLGRTQLTRISPKKTVEGALGGLLSSIFVAFAGWKVAGWPGSPLFACIVGVSLFVRLTLLHRLAVAAVFGLCIQSFRRFDRVNSEARSWHEGMHCHMTWLAETKWIR